MNGQDTFLWGLQINDSLTTELTAQMTVIALGVAAVSYTHLDIILLILLRIYFKDIKFDSIEQISKYIFYI